MASGPRPRMPTPPGMWSRAPSSRQRPRYWFHPTARPEVEESSRILVSQPPAGSNSTASASPDAGRIRSLRCAVPARLGRMNQTASSPPPPPKDEHYGGERGRSETEKPEQRG